MPEKTITIKIRCNTLEQLDIARLVEAGRRKKAISRLDWLDEIILPVTNSYTHNLGEKHENRN